MGSRVELFEQIRRDRDREGLSIRALAERHGVHRRAVRAALLSPVPPAKRSPASRPAPKLGEYRALIDAWLEADRDAPRKQRHTAEADLVAAGRRARRRRRRDDGP
jgi:transcriptional regulator with XRE-family HTH domain